MTSWKANNRTHTQPPVFSYSSKPGHGTTGLAKPEVESFRSLHFHPQDVDATHRLVMIECRETIQRCGVAASSTAHTAPHCAAALPVQPTVSLRGVGVRSWLANQQQGGGDRPASNGEHLFLTVHHKIETDSPSQPAPCGPARRQPSWRFGRRSLNAAPNSGYPETVSLPMKRSWSSWTNCDRASGRETEYQAATGLQPPGACGPERGYLGALNSSFGSANSFSAIGSARGTSAMLQSGAVDGTTANLAGRTSGDSRRDGTQFKMQGRSFGRAVAADGQTSVRIINSGSLGAPWSAGNSSSSDGLGNHQPGSMTRGTIAKVKTPSGRARDRAICPAVARFNEGRVA